VNLLLDTHILLWAAEGRLPRKGTRLIEDTSNALFFSSASIWEIAIKRQSRREGFQVNTTALYYGLLESGYRELAVSSRHALILETLPDVHRDPFDWILVAQALSEGLTLVTADGKFSGYPGSIIHIKQGTPA
jgi:PIN domain nuclease of toxin-antitoxin system